MFISAILLHKGGFWEQRVPSEQAQAMQLRVPSLRGSAWTDVCVTYRTVKQLSILVRLCVLELWLS